MSESLLATLYVPDYLSKDLIFDPLSKYNNDETHYPAILLQKMLKERGVSLHTQDHHDASRSAFVICLDVIPKELHHPRQFLVLKEIQIVSRRNWQVRRHSQFKKIFVWRDDIVDNVKYFIYRPAVKLPNEIALGRWNRRKFCTMIAMNKKSNDRRELYSERMRAIRWFESHAPKDFDLYGKFWELHTFNGPRLVRALNRISFLRKTFAIRRPSWKGEITSKNEVLRNYRYCICYENARDIPGNISEKIFHCFFAGCIPIYLGAPNIERLIPRRCFIPKEEFSSYEDLYRYLKGMSDREYLGYIDSIEAYLKSEQIQLFSPETWARNLIKDTLDE
jgi:hypothetical protein